MALWGYGREGRATHGFLATRVPGLTPTLVTDGDDEVADLPQLRGALGREAIAEGVFEVVVKSPGVSLYRPEVMAAVGAGTIVTSSTNLWFETGPSRFVLAVTGTKGKSTTASLIAHLWRGVEPDVALAGNVGVPLVGVEPDGAPMVLELSSYQIADLAYGPDLMVLTNLFPEHLDWHRSHETYFADKLRLVDLAPAAVLNAADQRSCQRLEGYTNATWYNTPAGWRATDEGVYRADELVVEAAGLAVPGRHNLDNLAAALAALETAGVDARRAASRAASFEGLRHRLEVLGWRDGRLWVNDSISTTPESAAAAVRAFAGKPLTLLLGGQERGQDPAPLAAALEGADVRIVTLPDNGARLAEAVARPGVVVHAAADLRAALARAYLLTPEGGTVLLSPAAPSYGHFRDFEDRGDAFRAFAGFADGA